ncbi:MAG TPA: sigma-70 family RNA polymerase sigma factor [Acidothermaceae bacterium]
MTDDDWLADGFDACRPHLHAVAYRMLGSVPEAEDAVQESWFRLAGNDATAINDLRGWLTTVVGRICLDMLRSRRVRQDGYFGVRLPNPIVEEDMGADPEGQVILADSVGMALLVVLETLAPAERLAFVLHDVFGVPFDQISEIIDRTPDATRQLASRARRRVQQAPQPDADVPKQRRAVDAFVAAAREGDFDALMTILDPDVVFRADAGPDGPDTSGMDVIASPFRRPLIGANAVARQVLRTAPRFISLVRPMLVNGSPGLLVGTPTAPMGAVAFTVVKGRIVAIDLVVGAVTVRHS